MTVLHVDDSAPDRYRRRRTLEGAGFYVTDADKGHAALAVVSAEQALDVVLLDVRLPDTTGFDLAREIKARAAAMNRDIGVVLVSSYFIDPHFRVRGLDAGADAYLIEPVTDAELIATMRAVSRVQHALKRMREQERLLNALFEYIPEGVTVADAPDVSIRRVSSYGLRLLGRSHESLEGIPASEHVDKWEILRADGTTAARPDELPLTRAATKGEVIENEEWVLRSAGGENVVVLCNAGPIKDEAGRVTGGVIAWRDITIRKQIEQSLARQTAQLQEADQAKNEFLAGLAHEMRQPLQAALAAVALMKVRADRAVGERAREVVERQLQQLNRFANDLLDAARIVRREVTLIRKPVDLREIVRRALETVRATTVERRHEVCVSAWDRPIMIEADAGRLEQVLVNILANAAKYTPPHGRIEVRIETDESTAAVRVRDSGEGIAPEHLPRIFDLFTRGTTNEGGFGIGLAVAHTLVALHGGTIEARSEGAGRGSEFVIGLPTLTRGDDRRSVATLKR